MHKNIFYAKDLKHMYASNYQEVSIEKNYYVYFHSCYQVFFSDVAIRNVFFFKRTHTIADFFLQNAYNQK